MLPMQHAMCTMGPSLPKLRPADTESIRPTDFIIRVHFPKYPRIIKPLRIVFICGFKDIYQKLEAANSRAVET